MPLVTLVRGFKVDFEKLDNFLGKHGLPVTMGTHIFHTDMEQIAEFLRAQGVDCDVEIVQAGRLGFKDPRYFFVCCDWVHVFASRQVDGWLADVATRPVPASFAEHLRRSLLSAGDAEIGMFIVFNEKQTWLPEVFEVNEKTEKPPCEICEELTESWDDWERHRQEKHGVGKYEHPLPDF